MCVCVCQCSVSFLFAYVRHVGLKGNKKEQSLLKCPVGRLWDLDLDLDLFRESTSYS